MLDTQQQADIIMFMHARVCMFVFLNGYKIFRLGLTF